MGCKHRKIIESTKYYYCKLFKKPVDDYKCKGCMMKIEDNNEIIESLREIFGGGFRK